MAKKDEASESYFDISKFIDLGEEDSELLAASTEAPGAHSFSMDEVVTAGLERPLRDSVDEYIASGKVGFREKRQLKELADTNDGYEREVKDVEDFVVVKAKEYHAIVTSILKEKNELEGFAMFNTDDPYDIQPVGLEDGSGEHREITAKSNKLFDELSRLEKLRHEINGQRREVLLEVQDKATKADLSGYDQLQTLLQRKIDGIDEVVDITKAKITAEEETHFDEKIEEFQNYIHGSHNPLSDKDEDDDYELEPYTPSSLSTSEGLHEIGELEDEESPLSYEEHSPEEKAAMAESSSRAEGNDFTLESTPVLDLDSELAEDGTLESYLSDELEETQPLDPSYLPDGAVEAESDSSSPERSEEESNNSTAVLNLDAYMDDSDLEVIGFSSAPSESSAGRGLEDKELFASGSESTRESEEDVVPDEYPQAEENSALRDSFSDLNFDEFPEDFGIEAADGGRQSTEDSDDLDGAEEPYDAYERALDRFNSDLDIDPSPPLTESAPSFGVVSEPSDETDDLREDYFSSDVIHEDAMSSSEISVSDEEEHGEDPAVIELSEQLDADSDSRESFDELSGEEAHTDSVGSEEIDGSEEGDSEPESTSTPEFEEETEDAESDVEGSTVESFAAEAPRVAPHIFDSLVEKYGIDTHFVSRED